MGSGGSRDYQSGASGGSSGYKGSVDENESLRIFTLLGACLDALFVHLRTALLSSLFNPLSAPYFPYFG